MAVATQQRSLMTAEDLSAPWVPEKLVELIDGELIQVTPARRPHNRIANKLMILFYRFTVENPSLDYCGDNDGFLLSRDPDTVLSPDACLFRARPDTDTTWNEFAPEIVAEVLSPSNSKAEMAFKRQRFFGAGTEQFWLIDPEQRTLTIYHRDARIITCQDDATIVGEGIATGLQFRLPELFQDR